MFQNKLLLKWDDFVSVSASLHSIKTERGRWISLKTEHLGIHVDVGLEDVKPGNDFYYYYPF